METVEAVAHAPRSTSRRAWLCNLYGFISAFEIKFAFTPHLDLRFIQQRIISGSLSADLLGLGLTDADYARLARQCEVPDFRHPIEALGWLFVVERLLDDRERWEQLGAMIDQWTLEDDDLQRLEAAARAALDCLEQWCTAGEASTVLVEVSRAEIA